ncbi:MAG: GvpL/GvpF family gas vesicle protein [Desulfobacterales bacterium]|nr:GvpL/GvpF family gas vesicle protein [Desulfobacterales bacterium]
MMPGKNKAVVKNKTKAMVYLYAIVNGKGKETYGPIGILDKEVYAVYQGGMAAVVSRLKHQRIRPQRRHMAAHNTVLTTLMADQTPMPVSFGIVAKSPGAVKQMLSDEQKALEAAYERVEDRVEMVVRVRLDVPDIFEYFVFNHPELKAERDRVYGGGGTPGREDKLELGRLFDRLLSHTRDQVTETVEPVLSGASVEILENKCRDERDLMDLSCLVERGNKSRFESAVHKAAESFDESFTFDVKGPWVPHSFVDLQLDI